MTKERWQSILRVCVALFFLFPFISVLILFPDVYISDWREVFWAFKNTAAQAVGSAVIAIILGFIISMGLLSLDRTFLEKWRWLFYGLCLFPSMLPSLFIILALLEIIKPYPMGIWGIIIAHAFIYSGLSALAFESALRRKIGPYCEMAMIDGIQGWKSLNFIGSIVLPILRSDFLTIFVFIFAICFGSFSIPLILGDGIGTTLEVLMYEKMRISASWNEVAAIAIFQSSFIYVLTLISWNKESFSDQREARWDLIASRWALLPLIVIAGGLVFGYLIVVLKGLWSWSFIGTLGTDLLSASLNSFFIGITSGVLGYFLILLISYLSPSSPLQKFLLGYVAPGSALAGFVFLVTFPHSDSWVWLKIPFLVLLVSFSSVYRMGVHQKLQGLERQIQVAQTLGATPGSIFRFIKWPQIHLEAVKMAMLLAIWSVGDFAISRIIAKSQFSLALLTDLFMSSYRLAQAGLLSFLLILIMLLVVIFLKGFSYVLGQRFKL